MPNIFDQFDGGPLAQPARRKPHVDVDAISRGASELGIDPVDLATAISYETGGTFDPDKTGPTTRYGQHRGLIQFGEPQRAKYGVRDGMTMAEQMPAVVAYLRDAGVKPGMGMLDVYSAINAGRPGRYNASDAAAGGAPGTVADKVANQMGGHRAKAMALFGQGGGSGGGGNNPFDQFDGAAPDFSNVQHGTSAVPAQSLPHPQSKPEPGYLGGIADAFSNLVDGGKQEFDTLAHGDGSLMDRIGAAAPRVMSRMGDLASAATPDIVEAAQGRGMELGSKLTRFVANVGEPLGDKLSLAMPQWMRSADGSLTDEKIQNEKQLQPLYSLSDWLQEHADKNKAAYGPTVSFDQVKQNPLSMQTAKFIGEQSALSLPDMAASIFALPAYIASQTEEGGEERMRNNVAPTLSDLVAGREPTVKPGQEPTLSELAGAAPGAILQGGLERFGTGRLLPGIMPEAASPLLRVLKETGVQAGTEGVENLGQYLSNTIGTNKGVDLGEARDQFAAGALVGGPLGTIVQGAKELGGEVAPNVQPEAQANPFDAFDGGVPPEAARTAPDITVTPEQLAQPVTPEAAPAPVGAEPAVAEVAPAAAQNPFDAFDAEPSPAMADALPDAIDVATPRVAAVDEAAVDAPPAVAEAPVAAAPEALTQAVDNPVDSTPKGGLTATVEKGDDSHTISYETRTRTDGSKVLVRKIVYADGETFLGYLSRSGEWQKGEPSLTAISGGAFAPSEQSPEVFGSDEEASRAARDDLPRAPRWMANRPMPPGIRTQTRAPRSSSSRSRWASTRSSPSSWHRTRSRSRSRRPRPPRQPSRSRRAPTAAT
jgi:hypothetical protein